MALLLPQIELLAQIRQRRGKARVKILSLGYPDILTDRANLNRLFGEDVARSVTARPDSKEILAWHGMQGYLPDIIDAVSLLP